jgi:hypothetical protein
MKRKSSQHLNFSVVFLLFLNLASYSQEPQTVHQSNDSLELQQTYIRNLVTQQKKLILKNYKEDYILNELDASKLRYLDSIATEGVIKSEKNNIPLKEATKEYVPRKSALRKTLIIGGLSVGAVAGVLIYFLTKSDSKKGSDSDQYITDKPPLHP